MAYECQNFKDGQKLTAACMNKIDEWLAYICGKEIVSGAVNERGELVLTLCNGETMNVGVVKGANGKSAYEYAQDGGYTGTETEFAEKLAERNPKAFYITLNSSSMTVDKSDEEIEAAYQAGCSIFCLFPQSGVSVACPLAIRSSGSYWVFSMVGLAVGAANAQAGYFVISGGKCITYNLKSLASVEDIPDLPTALPNPQSLTFVEEIGGQPLIYDGSEAQTVLIRKVITVDITDNGDGTFSASETFQNIADYIANGWTVCCNLDGIILPLVSQYEGNLNFGVTVAGEDMFITILATINSDDLVIADLVETSSLKNPHALTIDGDTYDGSEAVSVGNTIHYIVGNSTTAGTWTGTCSDITKYFDGLTIAYKINIAGVSGGTTLNINGLGACPVRRNASTAVTTTYPVGSIVMLTYSGGVWLTADYDSNTKTTAGSSNKTATKMYLIGGTSQSSSGVTTYSNTNCYIGTDNRLYSGGAVVPNIAEIENLIDAKLAEIPNASGVGF